MTETPICPACHAQQDDSLLCHRCVRQLRWSLRAVLHEPGALTTGGRQTLPWEDQAGDWTGIADQLTISLARMGRRGNRNGARSTDIPMPFDVGASDAINALRNALAGWVRALGMGDDWPEDTMPTMAKWLLDRMQRIRGHEAADRIKWDIVTAVNQSMRMIDAPEQRQLIGKCTACGGDAYANTDDDHGTCRQCEAVVPNAKAHRAGMLATVEDMHATRTQILGALPSFYGMPLSATRLRKWIFNGRLTPVPGEGERYRIGDVLDLANAERARRVG